MRILTLITALLVSTPTTLAALCTASGLLGLGSTSPSYNGQFYLRARSASNVVRTIITSPPDASAYSPLALGAANTQPSSAAVPKFTLDANRVLVPIDGNILVTKEEGLLTPQPLYLAANGLGKEAQVQAVNVKCDGIERTVLRFTDSPVGALGSATTNETFAAGAGISSPILGGLLTLGAPIDLLMLPFTPRA